MTLSPDAAEVLALLRSRGRPLTIEHVAATLDIPRRAVDEAVAELRDAGFPVGASNVRPFGVYLARTAAELTPTIDSLRGRAAKHYLTVRALRRARQRLALAEQGGEAPSLWEVAA